MDDMIQFADAIKNRKENPARDWCLYGAGGAIPKEGSALSRFLKGGFFEISNVPKFRLNRKDKVYTIGSCFAREIERALKAEGIVVPTADIDIDPSLYRSPTKYGNTVLNKYNPYSMAAELYRGLGHLTLPDRGLLEIAGKFYDPQTSHVDPLPRAEAEGLRDVLDSVASQIRDSTVFILTLGMTETWFDMRSGQAFNGMNVASLRSISEHLSFKNLRHRECKQVLQEAFALLKHGVVS